MDNKKVHMVAFVLLVIGGLNMGLAAVGFDVVNLILGSMPAVEMIFAVLVGLSALYEAVRFKSHIAGTSASSAMPSASGDMTHG